MVQKMVALSYSRTQGWMQWLPWFHTSWPAPHPGQFPSGPWNWHPPPPSGLFPWLEQWLLANHSWLSGGRPKPWPTFLLLDVGVVVWLAWVPPVVDLKIAMGLAIALLDLAKHLHWLGQTLPGHLPGHLGPHGH